MTDTKTSVEDDEVEAVLGYIYTHADCPHCNETWVSSGVGYETLTCTACDKEFMIREVR